MFIFYVVESATIIYREIQEKSRKITLKIQFRLKIFIVLESSCHPTSAGYVKAHNIIAL